MLARIDVGLPFFFFPSRVEWEGGGMERKVLHFMLSRRRNDTLILPCWRLSRLRLTYDSWIWYSYRPAVIPIEREKDNCMYRGFDYAVFFFFVWFSISFVCFSEPKQCIMIAKSFFYLHKWIFSLFIFFTASNLSFFAFTYICLRFICSSTDNLFYLIWFYVCWEDEMRIRFVILHRSLSTSWHFGATRHLSSSPLIITSISVAIIIAVSIRSLYFFLLLLNTGAQG